MVTVEPYIWLILVFQVCLWTTRHFLQCLVSVCQRGRRRVCPVSSGPVMPLCPTCRSLIRCACIHVEYAHTHILCIAIMCNFIFQLHVSHKYSCRLLFRLRLYYNIWPLYEWMNIWLMSPHPTSALQYCLHVNASIVMIQYNNTHFNNRGHSAWGVLFLWRFTFPVYVMKRIEYLILYCNL